MGEYGRSGSEKDPERELKRKCSKRSDGEVLDGIRAWLRHQREERNLSRSAVAREAGKTLAWLEGFENERINSINVETSIRLAIALGEDPESILRSLWGYSEEESSSIIPAVKQPSEAVEGRAAYDLYDYAALVKMQRTFLPEGSLVCVLSTDTFPASLADRTVHDVIFDSMRSRKLVYLYMWPDQDSIDAVFNHSDSIEHNHIGHRYRALEQQIEQSFVDLRQLVYQGETREKAINNRFFSRTLSDDPGKTLAAFLGSRETIVLYFVHGEVHGEEHHIPDSGARIVRTLKDNPLRRLTSRSHTPEVSGWAWLSTSDLNHYRLNLQELLSDSISHVSRLIKKIDMQEEELSK